MEFIIIFDWQGNFGVYSHFSRIANFYCKS